MSTHDPNDRDQAVPRGEAAPVPTLVEPVHHTPLAWSCPAEEGIAGLYVGWAVPAAQFRTGQLARVAPLADPLSTMLAAKDSSEVYSNDALVVGRAIATGLGVSRPIAFEELRAALAAVPEQLAENEAFADLIGRRPPKIVVAASGVLSAATLLIGERSPAPNAPGLQWCRGDPVRDEGRRHASDDGVLGIVLGDAGPWQRPMYAAIALTEDDDRRLRAQLRAQGLDRVAYHLAYTYGA